MHKRSLTLFAGTNAFPASRLPGTLHDIDNWYGHFVTPQGGAWASSEIDICVDPTPNAFRQAMARARRADVAYVFAFAHGYTELNAFRVPEQRVVLGGNCDVSVHELRPHGVRWALTVVDACRSLSVRTPMVKVGGLGTLTEVGDPASRYLHRQLFDVVLSLSPASYELVTSCGLYENAAEDPNRGGIFSLGLRDAAFIADWNDGVNRFKPVLEGVKEATAATREHFAARGHSSPQHPEWFGSNAASTLPLAVCVTSRSPRAGW